MPLMAWDDRQRRTASLASTIAAVVLILFALLANSIAPGDVDTFLLAVLVLILVAAVFQALVVVTGLRAARAAGAGAGAGAESPAFEQGWSPPPPQASQAMAEPITLKCGNCGTVFDVADTGQRPLRHTCPGCGAQGELSAADLGPPPGAPSGYAPAAQAAQTEPITLKCGNCATIFDVPDTGERPLRHVCPGCGSEGVLREEDIGPPTLAAAPAAPPSPTPAPAPVAATAARPAPPKPGVKTVRTLKLRCKSCSTVFTLRDTGERPLYHECPGCKATGVLR
ncbi:MAG TPA: hypothetical protein VGR28_06770 [Candidatus Thermoplasmatota archaeon]|jgi:rRNA maturation endonuclease Nob1|nr:hypothetical protein [Candidatus Thermoplasmatota archaeon]